MKLSEPGFEGFIGLIGKEVYTLFHPPLSKN
jgi:hypothetical protein